MMKFQIISIQFNLSDISKQILNGTHPSASLTICS